MTRLVLAGGTFVACLPACPTLTALEASWHKLATSGAQGAQCHGPCNMQSYFYSMVGTMCHIHCAALLPCDAQHRRSACWVRQGGTQSQSTAAPACALHPSLCLLKGHKNALGMHATIKNAALLAAGPAAMTWRRLRR